ncbi:ribosomal protein S18 acetylase RimI-like enzyme [Deinococcus yavapaiensis KR-236]|uniref:Ribosomal protein S18 acetylase RimI-like enzyme n=2 Tax=Deinococcus TaxID=1298 RepID=A0A318S6N5_9DEIO|nr:ribosomal protein S18 acetylase RimI-like enzyme [Deinococcus yavapaiensis KR-236]
MVRPARRTDFADLARVAYDTGFFGESARLYFPDETLFADLWIRPYVPLALPGFVALLEGRVVGSILGAHDEGAYEAAIRRVAPALALRAAFGGYPKLPACLPYLARLARYAVPHASPHAFPAHLHINVLASARGLGLGARLLDAYLDSLRQAGVRGVQLSATRRNEAALRLYESRGFRVHEARVTPLWRPWTGRDETHVVMARSL